MRMIYWSSDVCSSDLHGRFAGAGIADDDCQVVLAGDMRQGVLLLASQRKASTLGGVSPPHLRRRRETMPRPIRKPIAGLAQPLLGVDHVARREPIRSGEHTSELQSLM